jgi:hypothetical protein
MEKSLKEFIESIQHRLQGANQTIAMLKSRQQLPFWKFGEQQLERFLNVARGALSAPSNPHAREFLQSLVTNIVVDSSNLRIRGNNAQLGIHGVPMETGHAFYGSAQTHI